MIEPGEMPRFDVPFLALPQTVRGDDAAEPGVTRIQAVCISYKA